VLGTVDRLRIAWSVHGYLPSDVSDIALVGRKCWHRKAQGPLFVTQAAVPRLRNGGRIIAISSGTSKCPFGPTGQGW